MNPTCIVTGGNKGIGFAIAQEMAKRKYHVVITCRTAEKGHEAITKITKSVPNAIVEMVVGELTTIESTKDLGQAIIAEYSSIDVIFHNAGIWPMKKILNEDGLESCFMVNYLAMYILTANLLPTLFNAEEARIILIGAGLYPMGRYDQASTPYGKDFSKIRTYASSKQCGMLFMRKLAKDLEDSNVSIAAVHPGVFRTKLGFSKSLLVPLMWFAKLFFTSPKKAYISPCHLVDLPVAAIHGKYFDELEEAEVTADINNQQTQDALFEISEQLTSINFP